MNFYYSLMLATLTLYSFSYAKTDEVTVDVQGNSVSISNNGDVLCFISDNLDPDKGGKIFPRYRGLGDEKKVTNLVAQQNYIEVLKYVWSENNKEKRLAWLQKTADEGHIICMFELSKEYALMGNVAESHFWLMLGVARTRQDVLCCTDCSLEDCPYFLMQCYGPFLRKVLLKDSSLFEKDKFLEKSVRQLDMKTLARELEYLNNCQKFPSPAWLHLHGMASFLPPIKDSTILHPEKTFSVKRKEITDALERDIKTLREQKPKEVILSTNNK